MHLAAKTNQEDLLEKDTFSLEVGKRNEVLISRSSPSMHCARLEVAEIDSARASLLSYAFRASYVLESALKSQLQKISQGSRSRFCGFRSSVSPTPKVTLPLISVHEHSPWLNAASCEVGDSQSDS